MSLRALVVVPALLLAAACTESHTSIADGAPPGDPDADTRCAVSSECVVIPASCCGSCGVATREDGIAINRARVGAYTSAACAGGAGCPACFSPPDPTLVATCRAGRCAMVDVLAEPLSACTDDEQCRLRTRDCCECGGDATRTGLIAIRIDAERDYMTLVCDDGPMTGCPECGPSYPAEASAACDLIAGHCRVLWAR